MVGDDNDLDFLLAVAKTEIAALRGDARLRPGLGTRGVALHAHILDLLAAVEFRNKKRPPPSAPASVRRAFSQNVRQGIHMLRGAHAALPWLGLTREPHLNSGSLYLAEQFTLGIVGKDVDLVVVPDPEYMYSAVSWPFRAVIRGTRGFRAKTTRRPVVLHYPLSDADRLLLHPLFAHELGHAGADAHRMVRRLHRRLTSARGYTVGLAPVLAAIQSATGLPAIQVTPMIERRMANWVEEILCDHLALEMVGPPFLWAFVGFAMPYTYGEPGPYHPPNTLRVHLALAHLRRRGWHRFMSSYAPRITRWLEEISSDAVPSQLGLDDAFICRHILSNAALLQNAAIRRTRGSALNPAAARQAADEAWRLLNRGPILPVGIREPLDPRGILLGAWRYAIQVHGDHTQGLVDALSDRVLQELIGKALELATIWHAWRAQV